MRLFLLVLLLALRAPSLVQPAGGDQGLYGYEGQRILDGGVLYRDMWDQKPPGIAFLYAGLLRIWPHESIVAAADLAAAAVVAWLLVILGRRRFSPNVGYGAATLFLLFGDPSLQRLSGIYVRGQCEPFIALAVTGALVLVASGRTRGRCRLLLAGMAIAVAFWLKYNAITYGLLLVLALWAWMPDERKSPRALVRDLTWAGLGAAAGIAVVLGYIVVNGAFHDFRLATIDYNIRYSQETVRESHQRAAVHVRASDRPSEDRHVVVSRRHRIAAAVHAGSVQRSRSWLLAGSWRHSSRSR